MAQQTIGLGSAPNDGTGDDLRTAGDKINDNFTELYAADAAIAETIDDRVSNLLVAGTNITITYDDGGNTLTIDAASSTSGDIADFNEAVDDRVAALIDAGAGISVTYNDAAGTLVIANTGAGSENKVIQVLVTDPNGDAITTGDGKAYLRIPSTLDGLDLVAVAATLITASSSGAPSVQIHNVTDGVDMLSTNLTIDASETDSGTAATPAVINTANDDVAGGDVLRIDIDAAGTGAKGLIVELQFA